MGSNKHKQLMDAGGVSKLHLAVFQGKQEKVRKLLERGSLDLNRGDKFGQTPLHIACHKEGLLGCLRLLAAHNADLEALDANGNTALHSAAGSGAVAAAEFLLSRGLSVSVRNNDGHTPIDICAKYCPTPRRKFMLALLEGNLKGENDGVHSADRNPSGVRAVYAGPGGAAPSPGGVSEEQDASSETTALLTGGAGPRPTTPTTNANYTNSKGSKNRQLMYSSSSIGDSPRSKAIAAGAAAARGEQQSMSKTSKAAKVGAASAPLLTPRGGSATMAALSKGEAPGPAAGAGAGPGAGVAPTSHAGGEPVPTPRRRAKQASLQELHLAIFQGDTAKVEEVVGRGDIAALNEADKHGQTPLHLACYKGSRSMTRLLVEGGASLDAVDVNGNGVVHAAVCDSPAVLSILIDSGADVTLPNHDGLTPKKLCEQYCPPRLKERMLQLLRDATASQARTAARKQQLDEGQVECRPTERLPSTTSSRIVSQRSIDAVYHQLAILRSKLAATAAARTEVPPSEAAGTAQTENALLTLVEANVRVVEGQRNALADLDNVAGRLERMFRRLHMRLDSISPGDLSFS